MFINVHCYEITMKTLVVNHIASWPPEVKLNSIFWKNILLSLTFCWKRTENWLFLHLIHGNCNKKHQEVNLEIRLNSVFMALSSSGKRQNAAKSSTQTWWPRSTSPLWLTPNPAATSAAASSRAVSRSDHLHCNLSGSHSRGFEEWQVSRSLISKWIVVNFTSHSNVNHECMNCLQEYTAFSHQTACHILCLACFL